MNSGSRMVMILGGVAAICGKFNLRAVLSGSKNKKTDCRWGSVGLPKRDETIPRFVFSGLTFSGFRFDCGGGVEAVV